MKHTLALIIVVLALATAANAQTQQQDIEVLPSGNISVHVTDVRADQVILIGALKLGYEVKGDLPKDLVTIDLTDVDPIETLRRLVHDLGYTLAITQDPKTITILRVPTEEAPKPCNVSFQGQGVRPATVALEKLAQVCGGYRVVIKDNDSTNEPRGLVNLEIKSYTDLKVGVDDILSNTGTEGVIDHKAKTITVQRRTASTVTTPPVRSESPRLMVRASNESARARTERIHRKLFGDRVYEETVARQAAEDQELLGEYPLDDPQMYGDSNIPSAPIYGSPRYMRSYSNYRTGRYGAYYPPYFYSERTRRLEGKSRTGWLKIYDPDRESDFITHVQVLRQSGSTWVPVGAAGKGFRVLHHPLELPIGHHRLRFVYVQKDKPTKQLDHDFEIDSKFDRDHPLQFMLIESMLSVPPADKQ